MSPFDQPKILGMGWNECVLALDNEVHGLLLPKTQDPDVNPFVTLISIQCGYPIHITKKLALRLPLTP